MLHWHYKLLEEPKLKITFLSRLIKIKTTETCKESAQEMANTSGILYWHIHPMN